jgi:hypothetical protein
MIFNSISPEVFPFIFISFFLAIWIFVCLLLSMVGGWQALGKAYRAEEKIEGTRWSWQSGSTRLGFAYRNCLNITANRKGIYIAVLWMFRLGHPPLFIPWSDITVTDQTFLFFRMTSFRFSKVPDVPFMIRARLAEKIRLAVGEAWPGKDTHGIRIN